MNKWICSSSPGKIICLYTNGSNTGRFLKILISRFSKQERIQSRQKELCEFGTPFSLHSKHYKSIPISLYIIHYNEHIVGGECMQIMTTTHYTAQLNLSPIVILAKGGNNLAFEFRHQSVQLSNCTFWYHSCPGSNIWHQ